MNAVITGASKGIGLAIVKDLLKKGYEVWGVSRTKPEENLGESFVWVECDLSEPENIKTIIKDLPKAVDVLVNDAGYWQALPVEKINEEHYNKTMNTNFRSPLFLTLALLPRFNNGGSIVNISSDMSISTTPGYSVYSASKAALDRFSTTLAKERKDLKVFGISPSATDTPGARASYHYDRDETRLRPDEISKVVMMALGGKYSSGDLIVVFNNEWKYRWEEIDKYTVVNVDEL